MKQICFFLAISLLSSCTVLFRGARYGAAGVDDHQIFPAYELKANHKKCLFNKSDKSNSEIDSINFKYKGLEYQSLHTLLEKTSTRALVAIRNDSIVFEEYFRGYERNDISMVFSISKSVTSLLVGIAIDEGYIADVNDPVTKYIAELNSADPMFKKLTIKHLLDMRSGIKFDETHKVNPLTKMAGLYYGTNQMAKIKRMKFDCEPGTKYEYQSISTAILGLVVEKATKQSFAKYFEEKVWKHLDMEHPAKWSLDDKRNQSVKAFCGFSISAIDLAKIGRLYLNGGKYKNKQIVSKAWIDETLTPNTQNDGYQNQWYSFGASGTDSAGTKYFNDSISAYKVWKKRYSKRYPYYAVNKVNRISKGEISETILWEDNKAYKWGLTIFTGQSMAIGILGQTMFIDPKKNTLIIRLGDEREFDYRVLLYKINNQL